LWIFNALWHSVGPQLRLCTLRGTNSDLGEYGGKCRGGVSMKTVTEVKGAQIRDNSILKDYHMVSPQPLLQA